MRTLYFDFCVGVVIEMSNMTHSPVKDGKAVTRKINDTSFEEGEAGASKVQRFEEAADSPPWALLLQKMDEVKEETRATNERVDALARKVAVLEEKAVEGEEKMEDLQEQVTRLTMENATLQGKYDKLREDLDDQIDRGMRENIIFYGVAGTERKWDDTCEVLAKWLYTNVGGKTQKEFDDAIQRAHRGPYNSSKAGPRPIFAKINFRTAEVIRNKLKFNPVKNAGFSDQFSDTTTARRNEALVFRKELKAKNPNSKAFISYPAVVKLQKAGEEDYTVVKSF